jgi:hypothetical protein
MIKSKSLLYGFLFSAAFAALMSAADPGRAQTANSSSNASSDANAASGSSSSSRSNGGTQRTTINQTTNVPANTTSVNTNNINDRVSGGTNSTVNQSGFQSSDNIVRTTPTVYAPPVSGGNPCTLAVSGGVSVIGWGAAAGGTFVDQDCANRQKIAMIHNAGYGPAAKELMCNDRATYDAFKTVGQPCGFRQAFEPAGAAPAPMVQMAPVPAPAPMPRVVAAPPKQYPRCSKTITDNCAS